MYRAIISFSCVLTIATSFGSQPQNYYYSQSPYYYPQGNPTPYVDQKESLRLKNEYEKKKKQDDMEKRTKELEKIYQEILDKELHEKNQYKSISDFIKSYKNYFAEKISDLDDEHPAVPVLEKIHKNLENIVAQEVFDTPSFLRKFIQNKALLTSHDQGKNWVRIPREGQKVIVSNTFTLDHAILMLLQTSYRIQENCELRNRCLEEELSSFKKIINTLPQSDQKDHLIDIVNQITVASKKISSETTPVRSILNTINEYLPTREQTRFAVEVKKEFGQDKNFQKFEEEGAKKEHAPIIIGQYDSSVWKSQEQIDKEKKEKAEEERKKAKEATERKKQKQEEKKEKDPVGSELKEVGENALGNVTKQLGGFLGKLFGG